MDFLIQATQFILSLSILIVLHELGHFIPAKLFKTRVEKFYLFFDWPFSLFKKKVGDTEYGIGALPLGGYVKISGMVDESMDKEQMKKPPESWEFRSKPTWQRLIIMLGGVTVNLFLGVFIYAMVLFFYGDRYTPINSMSEGIVCDSLYLAMGFQNGDKIVSVDGKSIRKWVQFRKKMIRPEVVVVNRDGSNIEIPISKDFPKNWLRLMEKTGQLGVGFKYPAVVGFVSDTSRAYKEGLRQGDRIAEINGFPIQYFNEYTDMISDLQKSHERTYEGTYTDHPTFQIAVGLVSSEEIMPAADKKIDKTLLLTVDASSGQIGFRALRGGSPEGFADYGYGVVLDKDYGFFESIPAGYNKAIEELVFYIDQFAIMFIPETGAYKHLGGFGAIGSLFETKWNWQHFWNMTAFLSLILAFMNVLPIPALDGGHVMFLLYEMVVGKPVPQKIMENAQVIGMLLLLVLVVYANGMDIYRFFFNG